MMRVLESMPDVYIAAFDAGEHIQPRIGIHYELRPIEIHVKADGDINNEPSFAFIMNQPESKIGFIAQISLRMMEPAILEAFKMRDKK